MFFLLGNSTKVIMPNYPSNYPIPNLGMYTFEAYPYKNKAYKIQRSLKYFAKSQNITLFLEIANINSFVLKTSIGAEKEVRKTMIGNNKLSKPKCILFIERINGDTMFMLQMYY